MIMIRFLVILITAALLISSCRSTRKIQTAIATKKDSTEVVKKPTSDPHQDSINFIKDTYNRLLANRIEFQTFSAKINTDYEGSDGKKYDVNVFVRMKKDSII